jgi:hypothetical protein
MSKLYLCIRAYNIIDYQVLWQQANEQEFIIIRIAVNFKI